MVSQSIMQQISQIADYKAETALNYHVGKTVINKALSIPFTSFEDPQFYNHYERIRGNFGSKLLTYTYTNYST